MALFTKKRLVLLFLLFLILPQAYFHFLSTEDIRGYARDAGNMIWGDGGAKKKRVRAYQWKVVGNRKSMLYHLPGSRFYDKVSPKDRVYFDSEEEAQKKGYRSP